MTDDGNRLEGLRREYEAGRIDANSYIAAGGDPDAVKRVETEKASAPEPVGTRILKATLAAAAGFLILTAVARGVGQIGNPAVAVLLGIAGLVLIVLARKV